MKAPLALEDYALACAALGDGVDEATVLAHVGVDARAWPELDERWAAELSADEPLAARFSLALRRAQEQLVRTLEPLDRDVGSYACLLWHLSHAADREALLDSLGLVPGDLTRLEARWRGDPSLAELSGGPHGPLPPLRLGALALPPRARPRDAAPNADELPPATAAPLELTVRLAPGVSVSTSSTLPFAQPGVRPLAATVGPSSAKVADALPFAPSGSPSRTLAAGEVTSQIDLERLRNALPFEGPRRSRDQALDAPREAARAAPRDEARDAAPAPPRPRPDASAALPFQPRRATLTLEHYASLCAELHLWPGSEAQTLARYGVSPEAQAELHAQFRQRFAESPAEYAAYQAAYWARRGALKV